MDFDDVALDDIEVRTLFICADCGTVASCNSRKHYSAEFREGEEGQPTRTELEEADVPVDHERGVRLAPPCPCGSGLFNSTEVLALHYDAQEVPHVRR